MNTNATIRSIYPAPPPYAGIEKEKGSLLDKDGQKFIENNGSKQYRISLHPDFIAYDREKLLKHPDASIQNLARKLTPV